MAYMFSGCYNFHVIVEGCKALSNLFKSCTFMHTKRRDRVAYGLAKYACNSPATVWLEGCPVLVAHVVISDCTSLAY